MSTLASAPRARDGLLALLVRELAPTEDRVQAVLRIAAACTLCVAVAMVFQIPQPTYIAYIVFLISKDENSATVTSGIGAMVAVTLAILLALGLALVDTSEPALRLPAMAFATFVAMYSARTFALGPISFLAGFVLVLLQSLVDDIPNTEAFTHACLWLSVVLGLPIATTIILNLLSGPATRVYVVRTLRILLTDLERALSSGFSDKDLARWRETAVSILGKTGTGAAVTRGDVSPLTITRVLEVVAILEVLPSNLDSQTRQALVNMAHNCRQQFDERVLNIECPEPSQESLTSDPAVLALRAGFLDLCASFTQIPQEKAPVAPARKPLLTPDAFANPAHWQFAFKTALAVMIVYTTYTLLDWPGLRTSIVTCFFVALGSLGETVHKLTLRISGALIGGTLAGVCIVWVLPHMTDIGQLCALIAIVAGAAGWVATSSERIAYAGFQIAFAFFLGVLQDYAPANDLTVLRDRVVGVLFGNVVVTIIFSVLWPESARGRLNTASVELLAAVGSLLKTPLARVRAEVPIARALVKADHYLELSKFELQMLPRPRRVGFDEEFVHRLRRLAGAALLSTRETISGDLESSHLAALADWAERASVALGEGQALPPVSEVPDAPGASTAEARRTIEQLRSEIQHVVATSR